MRIPNEEILSALKNEPRFNFRKESAAYLTEGVCPQCGARSLWVKKENPYWLTCNHKNACGYEGTVKEEIPGLFKSYAERYPATDKEPARTANTYMSMDRGFDLSKMRGWFSQEACLIHEENKYYPTVRFYLDEAHTRYWERLIDRPRSSSRKANFGGKRKEDGTLYAGDVWMPPEQELKQGERCFLVEGIFHAIALHHTGRKAAAAFSCTNFPKHVIEQYKGKGIRWTLALDGDDAGRKHAKIHAEKIRALGEKVEVCLLPKSSMDWDDYFRAGKITDEFVGEGLYRGTLFMCRTVNEKAYHSYCKHKRDKFLLDFDNALYSIKVKSAELTRDIDEFGCRLESDEGFRIFLTQCEVVSIGNCLPRFLYMERDEIMDTQSYVFRVSYRNGSAPDLVTLEGSNIESPTALNKALLNKTNGGTFDGTPPQLKILRDQWFNRRIRVVSSVPFVGYDKINKAYIFQKQAVSGGRVYDLNEQGFFTLGHKGLRSSLLGVYIHTDGEFTPGWLQNYVAAFSMPGLALMGFWLGSLFVQQIREMHSSFPFLEFTGEPGAGKSTALEFLWKCCGRDDYEGFDISKATLAGRRRAFNQISNLPVVLIESDRDSGEVGGRVRQFNFDECKPFFNGRGTGTLGVAKRGNDTEESVFQASMVISQNAEVEGSDALLQRIVHCHVDKKHHRAGTREIARWFERQSVESVGGWMMDALKKERAILEFYGRKFKEIEARYSKTSLMDARVIKNHAQLAACGCALRLLFPEMTDELEEQLVTYLHQRAVAREQRLAVDHPVLELFWDRYHYLNEEAYNVGKGRLNHATQEGEIALSLSQIESCCRTEGLTLPDMTMVKKLLPLSRRHTFVARNKVIWSAADKKSRRCWVFLEKGNG